MSKVYKFSDFILDEKAAAFYRKNVYIALSSRAFDILLYLIERRGEIVAKDEILDRVWKDSFVEEANLPVHISALRRVLLEKKGESRTIRTISGRGYSFIASVEELERSGLNAAKTPDRIDSDEKKDISIAVLPFTFEKSSEDNEYLANGVTQSLIGDLSRIRTLRVLPHSAVNPYKNSQMEMQEIGFLLDADKILTGNISEFRGKWEISAELVNVRDKRCLWASSQTFQADDIFEVKKQISAAIAERLQLSLGKSLEHKEINSNAQKLYYRGKFILESRAAKDDLKKLLHQSLKFFNEAVTLEPNYALAYVGIGSLYVSLHNHNLLERETAYEAALSALKKALAVDDQLSEAYVLQGSIEVMFEFGLERAIESFEKAIKLNPNNADAYHWKSLSLLTLGNFEEAFRLEKKAVDLDPVLVRFNESLVRIFYFSGRYDEAITLSQELLEFNPEIVSSHFFQAQCYAQLGFFEPALDHIEKAIELRSLPDIILCKAYILGLFGKKRESLKVVDHVLSSFSPASIDASDIAAIYSALKEIEKAFEYLDLAVAEKKAGLLSLKNDIRYKNLRSDPRFNEILKHLNLI